MDLAHNDVIASSDRNDWAKWVILRNWATGRTLLPVYMRMKKNTPVKYNRGIRGESVSISGNNREMDSTSLTSKVNSNWTMWGKLSG